MIRMVKAQSRRHQHVFVKLTRVCAFGASHMGLVVKNSPANAGDSRDTFNQCLGWEDALEQEMATHSSVLAWKILQTEDPDGLQPMGCKESNTTE